MMCLIVEDVEDSESSNHSTPPYSGWLLKDVVRSSFVARTIEKRNIPLSLTRR